MEQRSETGFVEQSVYTRHSQRLQVDWVRMQQVLFLNATDANLMSFVLPDIIGIGISIIFLVPRARIVALST